MTELRGKMVTDQEVLDEVAARCRNDEVFRKALRDDPGAVLQQLGVVVPEGMEVQVMGDTPETECLVLGGDLTDEDLEKVAGGAVNLTAQGMTGSEPLQGLRPIPLYGVKVID